MQRQHKSLSRRRPLFPFRREDAPGQKETQTAQGHRRSTKETRASVRIAGAPHGRCSAPRAGLQTSAKAVSPLRFGHRAHKVGYGKVGNGKTAPKKVSITHSREQCELLIERGIKICQRTFVRITHSSLKFYDYSADAVHHTPDRRCANNTHASF